MGVEFPDLLTLESTAQAIGSNMFEGFKPTPKGIEIIRDYIYGRVSLSELIRLASQVDESKSTIEAYLKRMRMNSSSVPSDQEIAEIVDEVRPLRV